MTRTQIYLPDDLKLQLQLYSQTDGIPVSEIIRRSVYEEINKRSKKKTGDTLLKIASMAVKGGPKDLSTNIFDYLYGKKSDYVK